MIAIKKADADFQIRIKELDLKFEEAEVADRSSARSREAVLGQWASLGVHSLGVIIIAGFFGTVYYILTLKEAINTETSLLVGSIVGYVSAKADQVVAYFFGSSWGSKQKTKEMGDALRDSIKNGGGNGR